MSWRGQRKRHSLARKKGRKFKKEYADGQVYFVRGRRKYDILGRRVR